MYGTIKGSARSPDSQDSQVHWSSDSNGGAGAGQTGSVASITGNTTSAAANSNTNSNTNLQTNSPAGTSNLTKRKRIYSHCHVQASDREDEPQVDKSARRRLITASVVCLLFMIGEIVGGVLSNSLAIATDAAHLLTDLASFMISLFALWLSSKPASKRMSFGWYRAEVIGALVSVLMIWLVTGFLVYMAVDRLRTGEIVIDSLVMLITAAASLLVNIFMAVALHVDHGHGGHHHHHHHHHHHPSHNHSQRHSHESCSDDLDEPELLNHQSAAGVGETTLVDDSAQLGSISLKNSTSLEVRRQQTNNQRESHSDRHGRANINVRAAFIHVIGDFIQSLGVLVAALIIYFEPSYTIVDPICTFIFSIIVLITTLNIISEVTNVLMEGIPNGVNFIEVRETLQSLEGVIRVHNLRIWSLSLDKIAISTHLVVDTKLLTPSQALKAAIKVLKKRYNFFEITIQVEEYKDDMKDCEHCQDEEVVINMTA